jgi:hypothetical protein
MKRQGRREKKKYFTRLGRKKALPPEGLFPLDGSPDQREAFASGAGLWGDASSK